VHKNIQHLGPWVAVVLVMCSAVFFLVSSFYAYNQQRRVNSALCRNVVENRGADRIQWITFRNILLPSIPEAERPQLRDLVDAVLEPIPALHCVNNKPVKK
jgi:hypothetical protein